MKLRMSAKLRAEIEEEILSGRYPAGARLEESAVARQYDVSRTPVREAFVQLEAAGLVRFHPRRGVEVTGVEPRDVFEMFELRSELEGVCGRLAAHRATSDTLLKLASALDACEAAERVDDMKAYRVANDDFHDVIYEMSGNQILADHARQLYRKLKLFQGMEFRVPNRMTDSLAEHRHIFAAISAREVAHAEQALKDHVISRGERYMALRRSLFGSGEAAETGN